MAESREPQKWDRHTIKAELAKQGWTLTRVAEAYDVDQSRVSRGLMGADRAGAEAVSKALGISLRVLFPGLYLNKPRRTTKARSTDQHSTRSNRHADSDTKAGAA